MTRRLAMIVGLFLAMAGCKQQCFLSECDFNHYRSLAIPPDLESNSGASTRPASTAVNMPVPSTVDSPDREQRYLSLAEAIAIALEQGNVGTQNPAQPG